MALLPDMVISITGYKSHDAYWLQVSEYKESWIAPSDRTANGWYRSDRVGLRRDGNFAWPMRNDVGKYGSIIASVTSKDIVRVLCGSPRWENLTDVTYVVAALGKPFAGTPTTTPSPHSSPTPREPSAFMRAIFVIDESKPLLLVKHTEPFTNNFFSLLQPGAIENEGKHGYTVKRDGGSEEPTFLKVSEVRYVYARTTCGMLADVTSVFHACKPQ
jgi:hypothetical protein